MNASNNDNCLDGAYDSHVHFIGDKKLYPLSVNRSYDPPKADFDGYLREMGALGVKKFVLVQPSIYGYDNTALLDKLKDNRSKNCYRGIIVPDPSVNVNNFYYYNSIGVRGIRVNMINPGGIKIQDLIPWKKDIKELGWHIQLQIAINKNVDIVEIQKEFDCSIVIDHMGFPDPNMIINDPQINKLITAVRTGKVFVKFSAPYRFSNSDYPYDDIMPLAKLLLLENSGSILWGSDWPHTEMKKTPGTLNELFDLVDVLSNGEKEINDLILFHNPHGLYS